MIAHKASDQTQKILLFLSYPGYLIQERPIIWLLIAQFLLLLSHHPHRFLFSGAFVPVRQVGSVTRSSGRLSLDAVYQVPQFDLSFLSVSQLVDLGYDITLTSSGCVVQDRHSGTWDRPYHSGSTVWETNGHSYQQSVVLHRPAEPKHALRLYLSVYQYRTWHRRDHCIREGQITLFFRN